MVKGKTIAVTYSDIVAVHPQIIQDDQAEATSSNLFIQPEYQKARIKSQMADVAKLNRSGVNIVGRNKALKAENPTILLTAGTSQRNHSHDGDPPKVAGVQ